MLLAMLVSHYSTAELVKWRDNSHLRPCAAAITHKDNHAARLMLLRRLLPLCVACVPVAQACIHLCLGHRLPVCVCVCRTRTTNELLPRAGLSCSGGLRGARD